MTTTQNTNTTAKYATHLGDDALILGHRISEWCSNAPFLEEDIALANVALDYIGRARLYYQYAAELSGGITEDDLAFTRDQREFRNQLIHELPRGDFAFTMIRQLIVDTYNLEYLSKLEKSTDATLAAIASKALKESRYHFRRSREWILRLGGGTEESHTRCQKALDEIWGYTHELFELNDQEKSLCEQGIAVDCSELRTRWHETISKDLTDATLTVPDDTWAVRGGREGYHTENLGHLLNEMQSVHRAYPDSQW